MSTLKVIGINHPSAVSGGISISTAGNPTGTGLDLITTQTFSAATTVSVNNCFSSTYDNYLMFLTVDTIATAGAYVNLRLRGGGADVSSATYNFQRINANSTVMASARTSGATSWTNALYVTINETSSAMLTLFDPARAKATRFHDDFIEGQAATTWDSYRGSNTNAVSYDGFSLICANAITGTVRIYGYRN